MLIGPLERGRQVHTPSILKIDFEKWDKGRNKCFEKLKVCTLKELRESKNFWLLDDNFKMPIQTKQKIEGTYLPQKL